MRKNLLKSIVAGLCMTTCIGIFSATCEASSYNAYNGYAYDSEEGLQQLEETLIADGYTRVSFAGEIGRKLAKIPEFYDYYFFENCDTDPENPEDEILRVYIREEDLKEWEDNNNIAPLNNNTVLVDYTQFRTSEPKPGKMNNDIPEDWETGTITVTGIVPDSLKGKKYDYTISFLNTTMNTLYFFTLDDGNDWSVIATIPTGDYIFDTSEITGDDDELRTAVVDNENFTLDTGELARVYVSFSGLKPDYDALEQDMPKIVEDDETDEKQDGDSEESDVTSTQKIATSDTTNEAIGKITISGEAATINHEIQAAKIEEKSNILPLIIISVVAIATIGAVIFFIKKKQKEKAASEDK